jgi:hypothetical protein
MTTNFTSQASWCRSLVDFTDDVSPSISLLQRLGADLRGDGKTWFDRNLLNLTQQGAKLLISGTTPKIQIRRGAPDCLPGISLQGAKCERLSKIIIVGGKYPFSSGCLPHFSGNSDVSYEVI